MPRGSQHAEDEITWQTVGVRLGQTGLDLRQPSDQTVLSDLVNARFVDEKTVRPRSGYLGYTVRDGSNFGRLGNDLNVSGQWVYGHGARVSAANNAGFENAHHPFPNQAKGCFTFDGSDVMWTGDRLLVVTKDGGQAFGASNFWTRTDSTTIQQRGFPAHLPSQVDSHPPTFALSGEYTETCLTDTLRVCVYNGGGQLNAWVIDRATGAVIDQSEISGASNDPVDLRVINSGGYPVVVWRDFSSKVMYISHWSGVSWSTASVVHVDVFGFDIVQVAGGFHLLWREGAPSTVALYIGRYFGFTAASTPYTFRTAVDITGLTTPAALAMDVSPAGDIGMVVDGAAGLMVRVFSPTGATLSAVPWTVLNSGGGSWGQGLSIRSRGLKGSLQVYDWVVHAGKSDNTVSVRQFTAQPGFGFFTDTAGTVKYNSVMASKSFLVGDEVFCWLHSNNAQTNYLLAGVSSPQVCGFADREEATTPTSHDGNWGAPLVTADSLDKTGLTWTWIRPYNTGQSYAHGGNVKLGDMSFLPAMQAAHYGRSVYLSGSAVRNWDGVQLGDAGWQDYPVVASSTPGTGGSLLSTGAYLFRVYAVRYNARGERFESAARTYTAPVLAGGNNKITLTIQTVPTTNHNDVIFEVYRSEAGGTTLYLDGTVPNSLSTATITYAATRIDRSTPIVSSDLINQVGDIHAPAPGQLAVRPSWGPIGCTTLVTSGDRLWGAGGQVPAGFVEFSKLHTEGDGAGYDDLIGFQQVDTAGQPVTLIHSLNEATVVHQADRLFLLGGTGPDNYGRDNFALPQIEMADGAITGVGCVNTQRGVVYWGKEGPRLITTGFELSRISAQVLPLAKALVPTGVQVDLARQEVVWYTSGGDALLWNYLSGGDRWARWTGLNIAGASNSALVTTGGVLLVEDDNATGDAGQAIEFLFRSGDLRPGTLFDGCTLLRAVGVTGAYEGPHQLRFRVFYNGSPLWADQWTWHPDVKTWLSTGNDFSALTPAQIDAASSSDRSGAYMTHKRASRHECAYFQVEVSNTGNTGKSYVPYELALELGSYGGLARVPVNNFGA